MSILEKLFIPIPKELILEFDRWSKIPEDELESRLGEFELNSNGDEVFLLELTCYILGRDIADKVLTYDEEKRIYRVMSSGCNVEHVFPSRVAYLRAKRKVAGLILGDRVSKIGFEDFEKLFRAHVTLEVQKRLLQYQELNNRSKDPRIPRKY